MPRIDNKNFYSCAIKKHGITARGLNWNSIERQELRFNIILDMLPKKLSNFTLADAGCGFGDFYSYLKDKNISLKQYIGIDSLYEMYLIASKNTKQKIIVADICKETLPETDYYVSSGALNILTRFETYQFIQNCYKSSKIAFIFNVLHGDKKSDTYNYITTSKIEDIAKKLDVRELMIKDNYLENDITVGFVR